MASLTKTMTFYKDGTNKKSWIKLIAKCSSTPLSTTEHKVTVALSYQCNYSPSSQATRTAEIIIGHNSKTIRFTGYTKNTTTNGVSIGSFTTNVSCSSTGTIPIEVIAKIPNIVTGGSWKFVPDRVTGKYSAQNITHNTLVVGDSVTLSLSNRSKNSRYDINLILSNKIRISLLAKDNDTGAASYTVNALPISILKSISEGRSITATLQVKTYDVQYNLGYIGTTTKSVTVDIPNRYLPSIQKIERSYINNIDNEPTDRIVSGYSTVRLHVYPVQTDVYNNNSYEYDKPQSVSVYVDGRTSPNTVSTNIAANNEYFVVNVNIYKRYAVNRDISLKVVYTDKRGNTFTRNERIYIHQYNNPAFIDCEAVRCNTDGSLNKQGDNIKITLNAAYSECGGEINGVYGNSLQYQLFYSTDGGVEYNYLGNTTTHDKKFENIYSNLSTDMVYMFKAIITDDFGNTAETYFDVGSSEVLMDVYKKTISFGAAASRTNETMYPDGAFEVSLPAYLSQVSELVMLSPNGSKYKLSVDNNGNLKTERVF